MVFLWYPNTVRHWAIVSFDLFPVDMGRVHYPQLPITWIAWKPLSEGGPRTWHKIMTNTWTLHLFVLAFYGLAVNAQIEVINTTSNFIFNVSWIRSRSLLLGKGENNAKKYQRRAQCKWEKDKNAPSTLPQRNLKTKVSSVNASIAYVHTQQLLIFGFVFEKKLG